MFIDNLFIKRISLLLVLALLLTAFSPYIAKKSEAAALTNASIRLTRMAVGVAASSTNTILVVIKPASVATEAIVELGIPDVSNTGFTVDTGANAITHTTSGITSTGTSQVIYQGSTVFPMTSMTGLATAGDAGNNSTVQFTVGDLATTTLYGFFITGGITNSTTAGTKIITMSTKTAANASASDTQDVAVDVVGGAANTDQVSLSATVPATFNFALTAYTIPLGSLDVASAKTGSVTVDIDTNAANGWIAWIRSDNTNQVGAELDSAIDSISSSDSGSCVEAVVGAEGYVVDVNASAGTNGGGALSVASEYDCTDNTHGGVLGTSYEQIAQRTGVVESDTLTLETIVTISATNKAASDYADTWDVVGAGSF